MKNFNNLKVLDERSIYFQVSNGNLEVFTQDDNLVGERPLPIPISENISLEELYEIANQGGYDIPEMIVDIINEAVIEKNMFDIWFSNESVIFYSPSVKNWVSEPYEGIFKWLEEVTTHIDNAEEDVEDEAVEETEEDNAEEDVEDEADEETEEDNAEEDVEDEVDEETEEDNAEEDVEDEVEKETEEDNAEEDVEDEVEEETEEDVEDEADEETEEDNDMKDNTNSSFNKSEFKKKILEEINEETENIEESNEKQENINNSILQVNEQQISTEHSIEKQEGYVDLQEKENKLEKWLEAYTTVLLEDKIVNNVSLKHLKDLVSVIIIDKKKDVFLIDEKEVLFELTLQSPFIFDTKTVLNAGFYQAYLLNKHKSL